MTFLSVVTTFNHTTLAMPSIISIDDFEVRDVAVALRRVRRTDKSRTMLQAWAVAPARALSRLELARTIGAGNVNSTNTVLGSCAKSLALAINPDLVALKENGGDYVMFLIDVGVRVPPTIDEDPDEGVVFIHA